MADARQLGVPTDKQSRFEQLNWPELRWADWQDTKATLHMWVQVIGKIRLALATRTNHWWHVTLYPTCRGLTTSPMPYGNRMLQIDFDFLRHQLILYTNDGLHESLALKPMSVADFYTQVMTCMEQLGMPIKIYTTPSEVPNPIPFEQDHQHASYDASVANCFWNILLQTERVMTKFRARFIGKISPVHFFWGGFDLAITRFSGRTAPKHSSVPDIPDSVVQTAYSHEVSSFGFWPGEDPSFYAYAYPSPPGFSEAPVLPAEASFNETLGEFILPYDAVRQARDPDQVLLDFAQSTYEVAANLGKWDRNELEAASDNI